MELKLLEWMNNYFRKNVLIFLSVIIFGIFISVSRLFLSNVIFNTTINFYIFVKVYYWLLVFGFVFFILIKIRKHNFYFYSDFLIFSIVFLYSLFFINKGFDFTDEGFTVSKSWFMLNGLWKENVDFVWFTSFVGGLWFKLVGAPFILWERVGFSLLFSLSALLSYKILRMYFESVLAFFCVIVTIIFCRVSIQTINNNLPVLFILLSIYLLQLFFNNYQIGLSNYSCICSVLSGIMLSFAFFARFTNIILLFFPFLFFLIYYFYNKNIDVCKKGILYIYLGMFSGIIIGLVILFINNSLFNYISSIYHMIFNIFFSSSDTATTETHVSSFLLSRYFAQLMKILYYYWWKLFLILYLIIVISANILNLKIRKNFIFISLLLFGILLYLFFIQELRLSRLARIFLSIIFSNILLTLLFKIDIKKYLLLIFWSISLAVFSFLGTDVGLETLFVSGGASLLIPFTFLLLKDARFKINNTEVDFTKYTVIVLIVLMLVGINFQSEYIYRDISPKKLKYMFNKKELAGIYTHLKKRNTIEDIIDYFHRNKDLLENKKLLIPNSQPMLYALLRQKYYFITPWAPWVFLENVEYLEYRYNELIKTNDIPDVIILSIKNSREGIWPNGDRKCSEMNDEQYRITEEFIKSNNYFEVYENDGYIVFIR